MTRKDFIYSALIIFGIALIIGRRAYARALIASRKLSPFKGFNLSLRVTQVIVIGMATAFIIVGTLKLFASS